MHDSVDEGELFLHTLKEYLDSEGENVIQQLLTPAKVLIKHTDDFSRRLWNQRSAYIEFKVPVHARKPLESRKEKLLRYCHDIYEDTDDYGLVGINIGILQLAAPTEDGSNQPNTIQEYSKAQVYHNLLSVVNKADMDPIERSYLYEACNCAINGNRLAAATMLGCAAEHLLLLLSRAYLQYLKNGNGTEHEITNFETRVVNAKKAHTRLDMFVRSVQNQEKTFEQLGLENANLHFTFFDFIRQIRNESGHPTGVIPMEEDLNTIFANYQLLIRRIHPLLAKLPETFLKTK